MEGLFSTRETATAIWAIGLLILGVTKKDFRSSLAGVSRAFVQPYILTIFGLMTAYVVFIVFLLHKAGLWNARQLKDTILWAAFIGGAAMLRLTAIARDSSYFIQTVKDNLKLIVFIEFIVSVFVFSLPIELIIVPLATIVAVMLVFTERDEKLNPLGKLLNGLTTCFGAWLLIHAIYELSKNFSEFSNRQTLADFSLTPLLTICFFPFLFVMSRFEHRALLLLRLKQALKDPRLRSHAYGKAVLRFKFGVSALDRWALSLFSRSINNEVDVDRSIDRILAMLSVERNPPSVPPIKGWSPYAAKEFLKKEGFKTGYYTSPDDKEWYASASQDVEKRSLDTIEYVVEGTREAATRLKLILNAYDAEPAQASFERFLKVFKALYEAALQEKLEVRFFEELEKPTYPWVIGSRAISMRKEVCNIELDVNLRFLLRELTQATRLFRGDSCRVAAVVWRRAARIDGIQTSLLTHTRSSEQPFKAIAIAE